MVGAILYGYRNNFSCNKGGKIPKKKKYKVKFIDLFREGFRTISRYDDDLFVNICQYLMRKGYPCGLRVSDHTGNIDTFMSDALFSINPYHSQNLRINKSGFDLFDWRKQFDLFNETEITGLNYYRNRACMPIKDFNSFDHIKKILFTKYDKYNNENVKLKFPYNRSWKHKATWILSKDCFVDKDTITYTITYGCYDDYRASLKGKAHSSWTIDIESEPNENYIDFCLRIFNDYDKIISGDKSVLISEYEGDHFYLGGNFRLRKTEKSLQ